MIEMMNEFWKCSLNDIKPEAHSLKHLFKERWVRFHALPGSKRYPETEDEYREILRRHNAVLTELNGARSTYFLVLPEYSEHKTPTAPEPELIGMFSKMSYWRTIDQTEEYGSFWHMHIACVSYSGTEFDGLFRLVADNHVNNVMIISIHQELVFHPYDGGADIVLKSRKERDTLKMRHREWLSSHPEGF